MTLVTLQQAKDHLRLTTPEGHPTDGDLTLKVNAAEGAILNWLQKSAAGVTASAPWVDPDSTPPNVQAAVLLLVAEFWRFRGDDVGGALYSQARDPGEDLPRVVIGLLRRYTDPVLA
jgi:hypothetical protein